MRIEYDIVNDVEVIQTLAGTEKRSMTSVLRSSKDMPVCARYFLRHIVYDNGEKLNFEDGLIVIKDGVISPYIIDCMREHYRDACSLGERVATAMSEISWEQFHMLYTFGKLPTYGLTVEKDIEKEEKIIIHSQKYIMR